jgi:hypothetical protein
VLGARRADSINQDHIAGQINVANRFSIIGGVMGAERGGSSGPGKWEGPPERAFLFYSACR